MGLHGQGDHETNKKPSFNETYYGFRSFSHLLEDAQRRGIVTLRRDQKSGSYIIEDLGAAAAAKTDATSSAEPAVEHRSRPPPRPTAKERTARAGRGDGVDAVAAGGAPARRRRRERYPRAALPGRTTATTTATTTPRTA